MKSLTRSWQWLGPWLGLAAVVIFFSILEPDVFPTWDNAKTVLPQAVVVGIGALGMTFVVVSGGIDLSVGSLIALTTVVAATVINVMVPEQAPVGLFPVLVAATAALAVSTLCGAINGVLVGCLRIVPFIVTLGMMQVARGAAKWMGDNKTVRTEAHVLERLMQIDPEPAWLLVAPGVWVFLILVALTGIILRFTVLGRHIVAIGSNEQTARLCGINVTGRRVLIYAACGLLTGVAGIMQYSRLTVGDPTSAVGLELDIIAAVVIGGASLSGGTGTAVGALVGALMTSVLRNGCVMAGMDNYIQEILIGIIIVVAVLIDQWRRRT